MGNCITTQFIRHDLPEFAAVTPYQPPGETLRSSIISLGLKIYIYDLAILVDGLPKVVCLPFSFTKTSSMKKVSP